MVAVRTSSGDHGNTQPFLNGRKKVQKIDANDDIQDVLSFHFRSNLKFLLIRESPLSWPLTLGI